MRRKDSDTSPIENVIEVDLRLLMGNEGNAGFAIIRELDDIDREMQGYYERLGGKGIKLFEQYLNLLIVLKLAIVQNLPGFRPKFVRNTDHGQLLDIAISGVIRNLRTAKHVMSAGYFLEAHATLRMVQQWLETALILEGNPAAAAFILRLGSYKKLPKQERQKAISSTQDISRMHRGITKTFGKLSERTHVTATAINLSKFRDAARGELSSFSGLIGKEMWERDTIALAAMARNATNIFVRHFREVPLNWEKTRQEVDSSFGGVPAKGRNRQQDAAD